jgi:hypothetical protein
MPEYTSDTPVVKIPLDFTPKDLVRKVRELAAANPEYVYQKPADDPSGFSCLYVHTSEDGSPGGCIFGRALRELGVPAEWFPGREGNNVLDLLETLWPGRKWARSYDRTVIGDSYIGTWCSRVQGYQDERKTWAEAVRLADEVVLEAVLGSSGV